MQEKFNGNVNLNTSLRFGLRVRTRQLVTFAGEAAELPKADWLDEQRLASLAKCGCSAFNPSFV
jgi:hypothetical protein